MSYILDALRRAQAERDRGQVPGLHAQPLGSAAPPGPASDTTRRLAVAAVSIAGIAALALGGALLWPRAAPPAAPRAAADAGPTVDTAPRWPVVVSAPPREVPPRSAAAPPAAAGATPAPPTALPGSAGPGSASPVPLALLPPAERAALPPLAVGGSVWSERSASRFVVINGQVVHEGQTAAPGVVLEQIGQRSATILWRGRRIALPF